MANKTQTIRIESILGGHSPTTHFAAPDQFRASFGINPSFEVTDNASSYGQKSCGLLRPVCNRTYADGGVLSACPKWMKNNYLEDVIYVYDDRGSLSTFSLISNTFTGISDGGNESGTASGNGAEYYDNYMYFSRNTTIARYGPLNGTPSLNGDYWGATLGKAALTNTTYPTINSVKYPNHILHRHSDGKLYILDVVDNQGTIHYIKTRKATVEGDTDDGSVYAKISVGYGLYPTAIESLGDTLIIAFAEGFNPTAAGKRAPAKIAFWDTTSDKVNQITWSEYPDSFVSSIKNVNGIIHLTSANIIGAGGFRIMKYVGGSSFEELHVEDTSQLPFPGAVIASGKRLVYGGYSYVPYASVSIKSLGLRTNLGGGAFNIYKPTTSVSFVGSIFENSLSFPNDSFYIGYGTTSVGTLEGNQSSGGTYTYSGVSQTWWSQTYKVGQKFKITKIRIPLAQPMATNMVVTPTFYTDDGRGRTYVGGVDSGLAIINNTNYSGKQLVTMRPENLVGESNFYLELVWSGSALCVVGLPITIEYELLDD